MHRHRARRSRRIRGSHANSCKGDIELSSVPTARSFVVPGHGLGSEVIFVTGFARSGTTLVNNVFRNYLDAGFVNEGQFIVAYGLRLHRYGDLTVAANRRRLIHDLSRDSFFSILKRNYHVGIDWRRALNDASSFSEVVLDVLTQVAAGTGTHRIGSKYPVFGWHLDLLDTLFPECKVVHVVRDGRDCALSHRHVTWGHQNVYVAARHWRAYLCGVRKYAKRMTGRFLELRYEDLLVEPEQAMSTLERFVTGSDSGRATQRFMLNARLLRPCKIAGWRQKMTPRAQAIFEGVAGDALQAAGYPLTGTARVPSWPLRAMYVAHDQLSREGWYWARKAFPSIPEYK